MKICNYLPAVALLFTIGCSQSDELISALPPQEQPTPDDAVLVPLRVGTSRENLTNTSDPQSRAAWENNDSKWEAGDKIALYALSYNQNPQAKAAELAITSLNPDGKSALFEGEGLEPAATDSYFAAYPSDTRINSSTATFTIAATQTATAAPKLPMTAQVANTTQDAILLKFQIINAFLHVKLADGLGLTAIRFEGCDNESVAGDYVYDFAANTTTLTGTGKSITIENPGTEVYFTLPAITFNKGFKLIFIKGSEQMVKSYGYGKPHTFGQGQISPIPAVTAFTPTALTLGEVKSTYETPEAAGIAGGKIYLSGNAFQGTPLSLIQEAGVEYNIKGSTATTKVAYDLNLLDKNAVQKKFDLTLDLPTELYEVRMYLTDVFGQTQTTAVREVGVLGNNVAVQLASVNTSLSTLTRAASVAHGEIGIAGTYAQISDRLIAERGLIINGQRQPASRDNSEGGTIDAVRSSISSDSYQIGAYIKDKKGRYYDSPAAQNKTAEVIETPKLTLAGNAASSADAIFTSFDSRDNGQDGSSIYFKGTAAALTSGVSDKLLSSGEFTLEVLLDDNLLTSGTLSTSQRSLAHTATLNNQTWAAHTVKIALKYQGRIMGETSKTVHVTGIPYTAAPPTNSGAHPWSNASWNVSFNGSNVKLGGVSGSGEAAITSPAFHIPSDINISATTNCYIAAAQIIFWINTDFTVTASSEFIKQNSNKKKQDYTLSGNSSLTPSSNTIKCKSSYAAAGPYVELKSITVNYR